MARLNQNMFFDNSPISCDKKEEDLYLLSKTVLNKKSIVSEPYINAHMPLQTHGRGVSVALRAWGEAGQ